jgi:hypothetical protein
MRAEETTLVPFRRPTLARTEATTPRDRAADGLPPQPRHPVLALAWERALRSPDQFVFPTLGAPIVRSQSRSLPDTTHLDRSAGRGPTLDHRLHHEGGSGKPHPLSVSSPTFAGPIFAGQERGSHHKLLDPISLISVGWTLPSAGLPSFAEGCVKQGKSTAPCFDSFVSIFDAGLGLQGGGPGVRVGFTVRTGGDLEGPWLESTTSEGSTRRRNLVGGYWHTGDFIIVEVEILHNTTGRPGTHQLITIFNQTKDQLLATRALTFHGSVNLRGTNASFGIGRTDGQSLACFGQMVVVNPLVRTRSGQIVSVPTYLSAMQRCDYTPAPHREGGRLVYEVPDVAGGLAYFNVTGTSNTAYWTTYDARSNGMLLPLSDLHTPDHAISPFYYFS